MSFIPGDALRERLAGKGAKIRDRDVETIPGYRALTPKESWQKRIEDGKQFLSEVISQTFVDQLFSSIRRIHSSGITGNEIKHGNIIIEQKTGQPYIIDFEEAYISKKNGFLFTFLKDWDLQIFNLHFGTRKPTYSTIKTGIRGIERNGTGDWYAPSYIGAGLHIGPIWSIDAGYGRWHYIIKRNLPDIEGKRILDLGANNGCNALEILRAGAKEVVGVELDEKRIAQGRFLKEAFEWMDDRTYQFQYIHSDMVNLPSMNLEKFDLVCAFCSIYYLTDNKISDLTRFLSSITDTFILQCNHASNIKRKHTHTYTKASVSYNLKMLKENGFPIAKVVAPKGYPRPLIIAQRNS